MITVTDKAAQEISRLISKETEPGKFLRIQVVGGGCSGLSYKLSFDNTQKDSDKAFEAVGIKVVTDPKSFLYIKGMTLDFTDGLEGTGFNFINPNAKKSCGCGSSFSA